MRGERRRKHFIMMTAASFLATVLILGVGTSAWAEEETKYTDGSWVEVDLSGIDGHCTHTLVTEEHDGKVYTKKESEFILTPEDGYAIGEVIVTGENSNTAGEVTEGENGVWSVKLTADNGPLKIVCKAVPAAEDPTPGPGEETGSEIVVRIKSSVSWRNSLFVIVRVTNTGSTPVTIRTVEVKDAGGNVKTQLIPVGGSKVIGQGEDIAYIGLYHGSSGNGNYQYRISVSYDSAGIPGSYESEVKETNKAEGLTVSEEIKETATGKGLSAGSLYGFGEGIWTVNEDPTEYVGQNVFYVRGNGTYNLVKKG